LPGFTATGVGAVATAATTGAAGAILATVSTTTVLIEGRVVVVVESTERVEIVDDSQS